MIISFFKEDGSDHRVPVGQVFLGSVVEGTMFMDGVTKVPSSEFGHVIGFERRPMGQLHLKVQWEAGAGDVPAIFAVSPADLVFHS